VYDPCERLIELFVLLGEDCPGIHDFQLKPGLAGIHRKINEHRNPMHFEVKSDEMNSSTGLIYEYPPPSQVNNPGNLCSSFSAQSIFMFSCRLSSSDSALTRTREAKSIHHHEARPISHEIE
jgi:hypothetical protein